MKVWLGLRIESREVSLEKDGTSVSLRFVFVDKPHWVLPVEGRQVYCPSKQVVLVLGFEKLEAILKLAEIWGYTARFFVVLI